MKRLASIFVLASILTLCLFAAAVYGIPVNEQPPRNEGAHARLFHRPLFPRLFHRHGESAPAARPVRASGGACFGGS